MPSQYPTIQSAVTAARAGDTIEVAAGIYPENVVVSTRVTIVGENALTTIVDGGGKNTVFDIRVDGVELRHLTIRNGGSKYLGVRIFYPADAAVIRYTRIMDNRAGVVLSESTGNTIENNVFMNNSMYGISSSDYSSGNTIRNNTISDGAYGIDLSDASDSQVVNNTISSTSYGVYVAYSNNNNVSANTLTGNSWNIQLTYSNSNIIGKNKVSGGSIGIQVMHSQGNTVLNNTVNNSSYGIYLGYCGANTVSGNTVSLNDWGIELYTSQSSTLKENTMKDNTWGMYIIEDSDANYIYHNNFINNIEQVYQDPLTCSNTWRTPTTPYQGNYWSDYRGKDDGSNNRTPGDGIGDTLLPWAGVDWYPLMYGYGIHDVAITNVTVSASEVHFGEIVKINVTAKNEGAFTETFSVTVKYDSTTIGTQPVSNLASGADTTLTFNWNTTGVAHGTYTIRAQTSTIPNEADTADNTYIDGTVTVGIHDVAVIEIKVDPTSTSPGWPIHINVTVQNKGDFTETFNVTVYADRDNAVIGDEIVVGRQTVNNLSPQSTTILCFDWNTAGVPHGNYWISAIASVVPEETDTADNILAGGAFVGGIYPPYNPPEVNILAQLVPLALAVCILVALGIVVVGFFKFLMSPRPCLLRRRSGVSRCKFALSLKSNI